MHLVLHPPPMCFVVRFPCVLLLDCSQWQHDAGCKGRCRCRQQWPQRGLALPWLLPLPWPHGSKVPLRRPLPPRELLRMDCPWKSGDILAATASQRLSRWPQLSSSGWCSTDQHDMLRILRMFRLWNAIWFLILYMVTLTKSPSAFLRGHVLINHVYKKSSRPQKLMALPVVVTEECPSLGGRPGDLYIGTNLLDPILWSVPLSTSFLQCN